VSKALARKRALRDLARRLDLEPSVVQSGRLDEALTHDSYAAERHASVAGANERLEFLGDAVLGAIVAHALFEQHPEYREGTMSRMRAALVSRAALAESARRLDLGPLLLLGRGEAATGGAQRASILAAAFEAIVGALYVTAGLQSARFFVMRHHLAHARSSEAVDPKTALQEYVQAKYKKAPHYAMTAQSGPAHARTFSVAVSVAGALLGSGQGATKKQAEAAAAREALVALRRGRAER
jgi:ribonuclease-3